MNPPLEPFLSGLDGLPVPPMRLPESHASPHGLLLLPQDEIGGLQVLNGAGEWVDAPPVPGGLVVNLGEVRRPSMTLSPTLRPIRPSVAGRVLPARGSTLGKGSTRQLTGSGKRVIPQMLQLVSGGYYLATVHRVLPPPAGGPARLSVPYFFNPKLDADVGPPMPP